MSAVLLVLASSIVAVQRLLELRYSRRNERRLRAKGAVERAAKHYPVMVTIHVGWLVSTVVEGLLRGPEIPPWWPVPLLLFLAAQPLRYWVLLSLREKWSTRILVVPGARLVRRGPYRLINHPNYLVVVVEILTFPLIFGAWITALAFSLFNAGILYVRIREENRALSELASRG